MPNRLLVGAALVHFATAAATAAVLAEGEGGTTSDGLDVSESGDDAQPSPLTVPPTAGPSVAPTLTQTQTEPCMEYVPCGLVRLGTARYGASVTWIMVAKIPQVYTFDTCSSATDTVMYVDGVEHDQDACRDQGRNYGERVSVSLVAGQVVTVAVRNFYPWTAESEVRLGTTCAVATTTVGLMEDRPAGVCVDPVPCDNTLERRVTTEGDASWLLRAANSETYSFNFCGSDHSIISVSINDEVHPQPCASGAGAIVLPFQFGDLIRVSAVMAGDQARGIARMRPECSGILPPAPTQAPSLTPTTSPPTTVPTRRPTGAPTTPEPTGAPTMSAPTSAPTAWPTYFPTASPLSSSPSLAPTTTTTTTTTWIVSCFLHYGDRASCERSSNNCFFSREHGVCLDSSQTVQCTAHNECASELVRSYCDRSYQCHSCFWCERFMDSVDGRCPPSCAGSTLDPTVSPTVAPSAAPTRMPTPAPTLAPSKFPSTAPSWNPTTRNPTKAADTFSPTLIPTLTPTRMPTASPTPAPTPAPSPSPTQSPTQAPSTPLPTLTPSSRPTMVPTLVPTAPPTGDPTTTHPTGEPTTTRPTVNPSLTPSISPASSDPTTSTPTTNPTTTPIYSIVRVPIEWDLLDYDDRQGGRGGGLMTGIYDMMYNFLLPGDVIEVNLRRGLVVPNSVSATIRFRTFDARARIEAQLCRCTLHVVVGGLRYDPALQSDFDDVCPDNCETTTTTVTSSTHTETTQTVTTVTSSTVTSTTATRTTVTDTSTTPTRTSSTTTATTATATSATVTTVTATSSTISTTTVTATADPCLIFECSNDCTGLCGWGWNRQEGRGDCRAGRVTTAAMYNLGNCQRNGTVDGDQATVKPENDNAADSSFIVSVAVLGVVIIAVLCILIWFQKRGCSCDDPNRVQAFKAYGVQPGYSQGAQSIAVSPMPSGGNHQLRSQLQQEQETRRRVLQETSVDGSLARKMLADSADANIPGGASASNPPAKIRQMHEKPIISKPAPSPTRVRKPEPEPEPRPPPHSFSVAQPVRPTQAAPVPTLVRKPEPEPEPKPEPEPEPRPPPHPFSVAQPVRPTQATPATPVTPPRAVNLPMSSDSSSDTGAPVWLHGKSSKEDATKLMAAHPVEGAFFVREVESLHADYALCVYYKGKPTHHGIRKVGDEWQVNNMAQHNKSAFVDFVEQFKKPLPGWPVPFTTVVSVSAGGVPPARAVGTCAAQPASDASRASVQWPTLSLHLHPRLGKEGSSAMLRDKSSGDYIAGHFLIEATGNDKEYALCVNYKGDKAPKAKPTRHHLCPNEQGVYSVNKKFFGQHRTPDALVEALSVPGPASARSGWPVALSQLVPPIWLRIGTRGAKMPRSVVEDELKGSDGAYSTGKFLVREDPEQGVAVLSVNFRGKPTHHQIALETSGIKFWGNSYSHTHKLVEALSRPKGERPKNAKGQEWPVQLKSS